MRRESTSDAKDTDFVSIQGFNNFFVTEGDVFSHAISTQDIFMPKY